MDLRRLQKPPLANIPHTNHFENDVLDQLRPLPILPTQHVQHDRVRDDLRVVRVFLQRGGQRGLGLGQAAQVQLGDGLADDGQRGGGGGVGGEFFVDVEGGLVFLAALEKSQHQ